jgi:bifunctional DNA-binding transcriptional regulator/antitoxin component of YhaV-PrlF toxin-antitoxin module
MHKSTHGVVHGKIIELREDLGLAEGQEVEIFVKIVAPRGASSEGLRRCAGALANEWTGEDDRILDEIHRERKQDARQDVAE